MPATDPRDVFRVESRFDADVNKRRTMVGVECGTCGSTEWKPMPGDKSIGWAQRMFHQRGWEIGRPGHHRCPACIRRHRESKRDKRMKVRDSETDLSRVFAVAPPVPPGPMAETLAPVLNKMIETDPRGPTERPADLGPAPSRAYSTAWNCRRGAQIALRNKGIEEPEQHVHYEISSFLEDQELIWRWTEIASNIPAPSAPPPESRPQPEPQTEEAMPVAIAPINPAPSPAPSLAPEPPREPTREDNRRIMEALDQHYDDAKGRYYANFSDDALAQQLNIPRAWIGRVREQFYGPDVNESAEIKKADLDKAIVKAKAAMERLMSMAVEADKIANELKAARKALG